MLTPSTVSPAPTHSSEAHELLVTPAADGLSPQAALLAAREILAADPAAQIRVQVGPGTYFLPEPLRFTSGDSGRITWSAQPGAQPLFSAGRPITGWRQAAGAPAGLQLWAADLPEVRAGHWWFRDLYANDQRLTRACFPKAGSAFSIESVDAADPRRMELNVAIPGGDLAGEDAELIVFHLWSCARIRIVRTHGKSIELEHPVGWMGHGATIAEQGRKAVIEHARPYLDSAGEWYLDRKTGTLWLLTRAGEDANALSIIAPVHTSILELQGEKHAPVRGISFEGIAFEHANWELPAAGYSGIQGGFYGAEYEKQPTYGVSPAIYLEYAEAISFHRCRLAHTGANGLTLGAGTRDCRIVGCEVFDTGSNGIIVGWRAMADQPPRMWMENDWTDPTDAPCRIEIAHNRIHRSCVVQVGDAGVGVCFSSDVRIAHNEIYDMPQIAVSLGFRWGFELTSQKNCTVEFNHIHHFTQTLFDGGGVYTLGRQPGTVVRNNLIHDAGTGHGLYTDEGSSEILFEKNVIHTVRDAGFQQHYGTANIVRNNIFANCGQCIVRFHRDMDDPAFTFECNICYVDAGRPVVSHAEHNGFRFDHNLWWNPTYNFLQFVGHGSFQQWRAWGHDLHGSIGDPCFRNAAEHDYTLEPGSAAFALGFEPIDLSQVGPQGIYKQEA
jgi:hypothetical protein